MFDIEKMKNVVASLPIKKVFKDEVYERVFRTTFEYALNNDYLIALSKNHVSKIEIGKSDSYLFTTIINGLLAERYQMIGFKELSLSDDNFKKMMTKFNKQCIYGDYYECSKKEDLVSFKINLIDYDTNYIEALLKAIDNKKDFKGDLSDKEIKFIKKGLDQIFTYLFCARHHWPKNIETFMLCPDFFLEIGYKNLNETNYYDEKIREMLMEIILSNELTDNQRIKAEGLYIFKCIGQSNTSLFGDLLKKLMNDDEYFEKIKALSKIKIFNKKITDARGLFSAKDLPSKYEQPYSATYTVSLNDFKKAYPSYSLGYLTEDMTIETDVSVAFKNNGLFSITIFSDIPITNLELKNYIAENFDELYIKSKDTKDDVSSRNLFSEFYINFVRQMREKNLAKKFESSNENKKISTRKKI